MEKNWNGVNDLQGKIIRISTIENMPMSGIEEHADGHYTGHGVAFEVVRLLQEIFNFTYKVIPPRKQSLNPFDILESGEVDMIAAMLPVEETKNLTKISFSSALAAANWVLLMNRPEESASGTGILAPFDANVWFVTLAAVTLIGPLMYAMMLLRRSVCPKYASKSPHHVLSLSSCMWFAYSAIMKQGSTLVPANDLTRLLFATWWIFITILTSFYTANLTAFLTLSRFTLPIEDVRNLAEGSFQWVGRSGGALEHAITNEEDLSYLRESIESREGRISDMSDEEILDLVMSGYIYLGELIEIQRLVFRHYIQKTQEGMDHKDRCAFVFSNKPFMIRPLAFAFPANSTLPKLFNPVLRSMVEGGVISHSLQLYLPSREICPLNLGNGERQLRNSDLLATYLVVGAGFCAALLAFLLEMALWRAWRAAKKSRLRIFSKKPPLPLLDIMPSYNNIVNTRPVVKQDLLFYPRDFSVPKTKSKLLMDPHLFTVHRVLQVPITKPHVHRPRITFTE